MYLSYWKLKAKPFENNLDSAFYFASYCSSDVLAKLSYFIRERKQAAILTGDYGCGKTMLVDQLMKQHRHENFYFAIIDMINHYEEGIYKLITHHLEPNKRKDFHSTHEQLEFIRTWLINNIQQNRHNVFIIDEAQLIEGESILEDIRLLLNLHHQSKPMLSIILVGQTSFLEKVKHHPQLEQRVYIHCELNSLSVQESAAYIQYRLKIAGCHDAIFSQEAIARIHNMSNGAPRTINNLCDLCLVTSYLQKAKIIQAETIDAIYAKNNMVFQNEVNKTFPNSTEEPEKPRFTFEQDDQQADEPRFENSNSIIKDEFDEGTAPHHIDYEETQPHMPNDSSLDVVRIHANTQWAFTGKVRSQLNMAFSLAKNSKPIILDDFDEIVNDILLMAAENDDLLYTIFDDQAKHTLIDHCTNVAILCAYLGKCFDFTESQLYQLTLTGLVHDIGLANVPKDLIFKKGGLTDEERHEIRQHPYYGANVIGMAQSTKIKNLKEIKDAVLQEHEREGGTGYPQHLSGNQIQLYAKIIGLADVFEIACHKRKDRKSTLIYQAIKRIIDLDEKYFATNIRKSLIAQFSLFPKGTIVKLNSGEIGKVMDINKAHPMRPMIQILYDNKNRKLDQPQVKYLKDAHFLFIENVLDEEDLT